VYCLLRRLLRLRLRRHRRGLPTLLQRRRERLHDAVTLSDSDVTVPARRVELLLQRRHALHERSVLRRKRLARARELRHLLHHLVVAVELALAVGVGQHLAPQSTEVVHHRTHKRLHRRRLSDCTALRRRGIL
jgi:hypothetical protein